MVAATLRVAPAPGLSYATLILLKEVNPKIAQGRLGHATISQTMDTCSHVLPNKRYEAIATLEKALH